MRIILIIIASLMFLSCSETVTETDVIKTENISLQKSGETFEQYLRRNHNPDEAYTATTGIGEDGVLYFNLFTHTGISRIYIVKDNGLERVYFPEGKIK
jgi:hypothetical protein